MTDELKFSSSPPEELLRWSDGKLAYIHPKLLDEISQRVLLHGGDPHGASVMQRLDACDRAILALTSELAELRNEMSLLRSVQQTIGDLDERLDKIERSDDALLQQTAAALVELQTRVRRLESPPKSTPPPDNVPFSSVAELVKTVELMFDCKNGDQRSWHEEWIEDDQAVGYRQFPYTVLGFIAPASLANAQEQLRQALYTVFHKLRLTCRPERPKLYWRYAEAERIQEEYDGDPRGAGARYKIRTRIAIPDADFQSVSEAVKTDTGVYRVLEG